MKQHCKKAPLVRLLGGLLLLVLIMSLTVPCVQVEAAQEKDLVLSDSQTEENQKFQVSDMVPGNEYTQTYRLKVSNAKNKTLSIQAYVSDGSKKLADALNISVKRMDTERVIYSGLLSDMSWTKINLTGNTDVQEIAYEITVFLDGTADNSYQDHKATVALQWKLEHNSNTKTLMIVICIIGGVLALAAVAVGFILVRKARKMKEVACIAGSMLVVAALMIGWGAVTLVLANHQVTVGENAFYNGTLKVNLNDGKPVFDEEILFEPGMMIQKKFTIANEGNIDAIYHLWFSEIEGDLAKELTVEIRDGKKRIFEGVLEDLIEEKVVGTNATLLANEEKELTIQIFLPEESKNDMKGKTVSFRLNYDATQKEGNPNKEFE